MKFQILDLFENEFLLRLIIESIVKLECMHTFFSIHQMHT
jgi:hypothetical protein